MPHGPYQASDKNNTDKYQQGGAQYLPSLSVSLSGLNATAMAAVKNTTEYPNCAMVWTVKPVPRTVLLKETPNCLRTGNTVISKEVLDVLGMARHGPMER